MCILECVTQSNKCLTLLPVSTDTKQRYEASTRSDRKSEGHTHVGSRSDNTSHAALLVTQNADTLYPIVSVQYILYMILQLYD